MLEQSQSRDVPDQKRNRRVNLPLTVLLSLFIIIALPIIEPKTKNFETATAESLVFFEQDETTHSPLVIQENSLRTISSTTSPEELIRVVKVFEQVKITGYSSTYWQTDDTPFITASGKWVYDGIIATNLLPFGTKVRIPEIYGNRIFIVEDRMHSRNSYNADIWFANYWEAKTFGVKIANLEILE